MQALISKKTTLKTVLSMIFSKKSHCFKPRPSSDKKSLVPNGRNEADECDSIQQKRMRLVVDSPELVFDGTFGFDMSVEEQEVGHAGMVVAHQRMGAVKCSK